MKRKLGQYQLKETEMKGVKAASSFCGCGCCYAASGGSSIEKNHGANLAGGKYSPCDWVLVTVIW